MNTRRLYLHFCNFAGEVILSSNIFFFGLFFKHLILLIKIKLLVFRLKQSLELCFYLYFTNQQKNFVQNADTPLLHSHDHLHNKKRLVLTLKYEICRALRNNVKESFVTTLLLVSLTVPSVKLVDFLVL